MKTPEKKKIDRLVSPEELDKRLVVLNPRAWISLFLTLLLILGALGWAIFGEIPNILHADFILLNESGFEILKTEESGVVKNLHIKRGDTVQAGDVIAQVENEEKKVVNIKAHEAGTVIEVFETEGQKVNKDDILVIVQKEKGNLYFFGFLPLDRGQQVQKGMEVYLQPSGVNVQEYGSIVAKISYISPYIVSHGQLLELLGDEGLIPFFTQNKPVVEIRADPLKNPGTLSGYQWTSGTGPKEKIAPLTLAKGLIVLQSRRPISYVIPIWRFKKLSYEVGGGK